jgi:hypothetical protein
MTLSGLCNLDKSAIVGLLFVVSGKRYPLGRKFFVGFDLRKVEKRDREIDRYCEVAGSDATDAALLTLVHQLKGR